MQAQEKRISYGWYVLALFLIIAAGRVTTFIYNNVSVDISYAGWVSGVLEYGMVFFTAAKNALGYSAVAYAVWHLSVKADSRMAVLFFIGLAAENAARFLIDYFTSSLSAYGVTMSLISLGLQLLYETVFLLLAWVTARLFRHLYHCSGHLRKERRYSAKNAARLSLLLLMAAQLVSELIYLMEFLSVYTDITNTEIASCVGSFVYIIVMYGGVPLLLCEAAFWFLRRITVVTEGKQPAPLPNRNSRKTV